MHFNMTEREQDFTTEEIEGIVKRWRGIDWDKYETSPRTHLLKTLSSVSSGGVLSMEEFLNNIPESVSTPKIKELLSQEKDNLRDMGRNLVFVEHPRMPTNPGIIIEQVGRSRTYDLIENVCFNGEESIEVSSLQRNILHLLRGGKLKQLVEVEEDDFNVWEEKKVPLMAFMDLEESIEQAGWESPFTIVEDEVYGSWVKTHNLKVNVYGGEVDEDRITALIGVFGGDSLGETLSWLGKMKDGRSYNKSTARVTLMSAFKNLRVRCRGGLATDEEVFGMSVIIDGLEHDENVLSDGAKIINKYFKSEDQS
jgi:hypothetical protein